MPVRVCVQWVTLLALSAAVVADGQKMTDAAGKLFKWIENNGGKIGFELGKDCNTCPRGTLATQAYKEGDTIAEIPFKLAIPLSGKYSCDQATELIRTRLQDPEHNKTYGFFWETQPDVDELLSSDMFSDEMLDMLQNPTLEGVVRSTRDYTEAVYAGTAGEEEEGEPLAVKLGAGCPSLQQFKWYTALITSRAFAFHYGNDEGHDVGKTYLFPALDLLNHAEPDAVNSRRWEYAEEGVVRQLATKDIKKGEQLYHAYHESVLQRPDMSLVLYGFVPERSPPLLAASDLHDYDVENPYRETAPNDDAHLPGGELHTGMEFGRLLDIKRSWPTSLEEDEKLLKQVEASDWQRRAVLLYRVQRKKAVLHNLKLLRQSLEGEL